MRRGRCFNNWEFYMFFLVNLEGFNDVKGSWCQKNEYI